MHRPANGQLAKQIQDNTEVQLSLYTWNFRNNRYLLGIRFQCRKVPLNVFSIPSGRSDDRLRPRVFLRGRP